MHGYTVKLNGTKAIIEIDLKSDLGVSKSGKSTLVASTKGNQPLAPGIVFGLNVFKPL